MYRPGIYVSIGGGPEDNIKMNLRQIESQIDKILPSIFKTITEIFKFFDVFHNELYIKFKPFKKFYIYL